MKIMCHSSAVFSRLGTFHSIRLYSCIRYDLLMQAIPAPEDSCRIENPQWRASESFPFCAREPQTLTDLVQELNFHQEQKEKEGKKQ